MPPRSLPAGAGAAAARGPRSPPVEGGEGVALARLPAAGGAVAAGVPPRPYLPAGAAVAAAGVAPFLPHLPEEVGVGPAAAAAVAVPLPEPEVPEEPEGQGAVAVAVPLSPEPGQPGTASLASSALAPAAEGAEVVASPGPLVAQGAQALKQAQEPEGCPGRPAPASKRMRPRSPEVPARLAASKRAPRLEA